MNKNISVDIGEPYAWFVRMTDFENSRIGFVDGNRYCDEKTYNFLKKSKLFGNELLFSKRGEIGKVYVMPKLKIASTLGPNLYLILLNDLLIPSFALYFFSSFYGQIQLNNANKSTTLGALYKEDVKNFICVYPPLPEQHAIAAFLDRETARIDALIEKKERQIELLQEKRVALISHAVTKGLDPNVKMKDSGIEWLCEVPEGWAVVRLKFYCSVNPSKTEIGFLPDDLEVSFLPMENLGEDHSLCLDLIKPLSEVWNAYTYFKENDVILAKITPCFENGKCSVCSGLKNKIGFGTTELHVLRALNSIIPRFCYYIVQNHAFKSIGTELMFGTTGQKRLPDSYVKDYKQGIPPLSEQHAIAAFLDRETAHIDNTIDKIKVSKGKLEEYRSALISAAVTGKIDVRREVTG